MNRLLACALLSASAFLVSAASAHSVLLNSNPKNGSEGVAPRELRLHFNEPVESGVSIVKLQSGDGKLISTEKVHADAADAATIVVKLPDLPAGAYRAQWSTMGHDGHHVKGELSFSVK